MNSYAAKLAQMQLDAYNNQDIEQFLQVYSDDVEVLDFPSNKALYTGIEKMRERYTNLFADNPSQNAELLSRTVKGNIVIDHEYVTGRASGVNTEAIAIYEVKEDKIAKVWFIR
ncbi:MULTISPECIES: nuclear transport factor 2 family protein [Bacillus]|uniref:nuclear transport factor 2 family protein n=1 Tax=Bacillus TaxID=1386 RepID=UPI002155CED0|nr:MULTISPECIES: nuclear transport factor 2 family protein [Bacillus]